MAPLPSGRPLLPGPSCPSESSPLLPSLLVPSRSPRRLTCVVAEGIGHWHCTRVCRTVSPVTDCLPVEGCTLRDQPAPQPVAGGLSFNGPVLLSDGQEGAWGPGSPVVCVSSPVAVHLPAGKAAPAHPLGRTRASCMSASFCRRRPWHSGQGKTCVLRPGGCVGPWGPGAWAMSSVLRTADPSGHVARPCRPLPLSCPAAPAQTPARALTCPATLLLQHQAAAGRHHAVPPRGLRLGDAVRPGAQRAGERPGRPAVSRSSPSLPPALPAQDTPAACP